MLDFQQKRKVKGVMYHRGTLIILGILVLFFMHSTWGAYQKKRKSEEARNISQVHLMQLEVQNKDLQERIARLQTDPGIEEEIRSKFTVAKAGENMVIIVDDTSTATTTPPPAGLWKKFTNWFK